MQKFKFEELRIYQEAVDFSHNIFAVTKDWPVIYRFSLIDQLQRAALSISLNIAEGSSRTTKDFQHFLSVSRGSCYECVPILTIASHMSILSEKDYERLYEQLVRMSKMITLLRSRII